MVRAASLGAALLLLGYASASAHDFWPYGVEPPPPSYLSKTPPLPVIIRRVKDIDAACSKALGVSAPVEFNGCTVLTDTRCDVYVPIADYRRYSDGKVAAIIAHEVFGHCNGLIHPGNASEGWATKDGMSVP